MKRWLFYLIVLIQVLFLVMMSAAYYAMDVFGTSIKLKTAPVDPRDPFYGDYVNLSYEVEQVPESKWSGSEEMERGDRVFLLLEANQQGFYDLVEASNLWMKAEKYQVVLQSSYEWHDAMAKVHQVDIGLGRFYIEENTGKKYERNIEDGAVEVILAPWGQKKIESLEVSD